jgi:hypothetical protein
LAQYGCGAVGSIGDAMENGPPQDTMTAPWHQLLAAIPKDARINRRPVTPAGLPKAAESEQIAEWESLSVELSDGNAGLRHLLITLDQQGRPISANDLVLFRRAIEDGRIEVRTESIGGRIAADGRFFGTRWTSIGYEERANDGGSGIESKPADPSDVDIDRLLALVREIVKRKPAKPPRAHRPRGRAARDKGA